jgi:tetratricopeptide (TPR) repeat protein
MIHVGPVQIRPLNDDEESVINLRLHLDAGADKGATRYLAGSARGAAERFPKSLTVLNTMARAELMANHFDDGNAAADRALAIDPNSVAALTYKGWALTGLAKTNPNTDWAAVRSYLTKANHLDPRAPEPLMYYYESFVKQGVKPPPQAVDALLGALELAPEDQALRVVCVRQLLRDGDLKTARMLFAPIAYNAHYNAARRHILDIMGKITGGNAASAVAMLDDDQKKSGEWFS